MAGATRRARPSGADDHGAVHAQGHDHGRGPRGEQALRRDVPPSGHR